MINSNLLQPNIWAISDQLNWYQRNKGRHSNFFNYSPNIKKIVLNYAREVKDGFPIDQNYGNKSMTQTEIA